MALLDPPISIDAIHQKIGRNLLLYQKLELMLKSMLVMLGVSGHPRQLVSNLEKRKAEIKKLMLGPAVGQHIESLNQNLEEDDAAASSVGKAPFMSIRLSTHCEDHVLEKREQILADLVGERNDLVHHLLTRFDLQKQEDLQALGTMLDDQHRRLTEEVSLTHELGQSQFDTRKEMQKLFETEEVRAWFAGKTTDQELAEGMRRLGYEIQVESDNNSNAL